MYKTLFKTANKYGAIRQTYDGYSYDSKFEAHCAHELDLLVKAKQIKGWDRQFKVEMIAYNEHGEPVMRKNHKIDFRIHELDGTFRLIEAKGVETQDYKDRREWLEKLWLPVNPDYTYEVWKQKNYGYKAKKRV